MALAVVIRPLSSSSDGLPIAVSGTTGAVNLHTGPTATNVFDRVFIYAGNTLTLSVFMTIEWGASTTLFREEIPARAIAYPVLTGQLLLGRSGSVTATILKAFSTHSATLRITGYVDRVTET